MALGAKGQPPVQPVTTPAPRQSRGPLIATLALACLLTAGAAAMLLILFAELPANQLAQLNINALAAARQHYRGPAMEASVLIATSAQIATAARDPNTLAATLDEARGRLRLLKSTGLGHVQYVTLAMLQSERNGETAGDAWKRIGELYAALPQRPLNHHFKEFAEAERAAWLAAGLSPRAASIRADSMSAAHGVLLQCFTHASRRMIDALRAAGDDGAAATCERVLFQVLRTLVLSEGPPELRVPTAALLAEQLRLREPASTTEQAAADACVEWRTAMHDLATAGPLHPYALRGSEPAMLWTPDDSGTITLVPLWIAGAAGGAAIVAIAALVLASLRRVRTTIGRADVLHAIVIAAGVCGVAMIAVDRAPSLVHHDLTRLSSDQAGVPRGPLIWAGAVAGAIVLISLIPRTAFGGRNRATSLAALATCAWPALLLAALLVVPHARQVLEHEPPFKKSAGALTVARHKIEQPLRAALQAWTP